jgi:hypothetical protein
MTKLHRLTSAGFMEHSDTADGKPVLPSFSNVAVKLVGRTAGSTRTRGFAESEFRFQVEKK